MKVTLITIHKGDSQTLISTINSILPYIKHPIFSGLLIFESGGKSLTDDYLHNTKKIVYSHNNKILGITNALNTSQNIAEKEFPNSTHHSYIHSGDKIIFNKELNFILDNINNNYSNFDLIFWRTLYKTRISLDELTPIFQDIKFGMSIIHMGTVISNKLHKSLGGYNKNYKYAMDFDFFLRSFLKKIKYKELDTKFIEMDGNGISSQNAYASIREVSKSILINLKFPNNFYFSFYTLTKSYLRRFLYTLLINNPLILNKLRKIFNKRIKFITKIN